MGEGVLAGWGTRLHERADFEASYAELENEGGYTAQVFRARCQSLQGKIESAARRFKNVRRFACDPERAVIADAYERENALVAGNPIASTILPGVIAAARDTVRRAHRTLDAAEAMFRGECERASWLLSDLIDNTQGEICPEQKALWYVLLAAALSNLDQIKPALRALETAGLYVLNSTGRLLGQVRLSARLAQTYEFLDCPEPAREWWVYHDRVPCPQATKLAMRRRAATLLRRSVKQGRCLLC